MGNITNNTDKVANEADMVLRSKFSGLVVWERIVLVIVVVIAIAVIIKLFDKFVERQLNSEKMKSKGSYYRIVTITTLIKRMLKIALVFIGVTIIMGAFNISIAPLLATVGIFSLAIGVGAQNLVKDVINGFFIIFEDQYSVGDLVEVNGIEGRVEDLGLRVTKIRDFGRILHIIPNSNISIVSNKERAAVRTKIDFYIDNSEDPEFVCDKIREAISKYDDAKEIVTKPDLWGVVANEKDYYKLTLVYYTKQGEQYDLEYAIRSDILRTLQGENIKTPRVKNEIYKKVEE
ncbi:mechanosensitive ion channel family protein [Peptoniphilus sp. MSJ-1]|uniref:Mechanosensitive ion channel family protein n=1 Tax=Peptoniphilus ovalis TaxID=2841503 RepID=A0ABS6FK46_9FIRM|nr:mechanosensitive ion channel family protein [Peptoniphilus ovalis]MBU5669887.1 mechanosensitive ion channel family protein [Peptoniphilus ovalis]